MKYQSIDQVILKSVGKKVLLHYGVAQASGIVKYVTVQKNNKFTRKRSPELICLVPETGTINCIREMFIDACVVRGIYFIKDISKKRYMQLIKQKNKHSKQIIK
jgi:hypothetical protein